MNANHLIATAGLALALTTGASKAAPVVFNFTGGFQSFTAPTTGIYDITAIGAQGGAGFQGGTGGLGAKVAGDFMLTQGEMLSILVGGRGQDGLGAGGFDSGGGGGGGSYVLGPGSQQVTFNPTSGVYTTNQYNFAALAIAGGGGGGAPDGGSNGIAGQAGREGTDNLSNPSAAPAGYGGNSGDGSTAGGGGAGLFTRGDGGDGGGGNPPFLPPPSSSAIHIASIPLGEGGGGTGLGGDGGFGGGGGGTQGVAGVDGGGGGGGYIGGDGGGVPGAQGGGAGSFLADGTPVNRDFVDLSGVNSGDGLVTIDFVPTMTSGVPEPSTWAMMLLGFGGLGFLGYRKSRKGDAVAMLAA